MGTIVKPVRIGINASSICQLKCPECPTSTNVRGLKDGEKVMSGKYGRYIKSSDFDSLIADNPRVKHIDLSCQGELFLNPDLLEILKRAFERNVKLDVGAGVNLNTASDSILEALVRYRLQRMTISIDGACNETYSRYRVGGNFDIVIENIRTINSYKKQYRSRFPILTWKFCVFGFNEQEISKAREFAHELEMEFTTAFGIHSFSLGDSNRDTDSLFSPVTDKERLRNEFGYASLDERNDNNRRYPPCPMLWEAPSIDWDGTMCGCCVVAANMDMREGFGSNAFKEGLLNSINSEKIRYAREMLQGKVPGRSDIPCADCFFFQDMQAGEQWLNMGGSSMLFWRAVDAFDRKSPTNYDRARSVYRFLKRRTYSLKHKPF